MSRMYKTNEGSPPRVRGKPDELIKSADKGRITPACAGKTRVHLRGYGFYRDHPRVCGENLLISRISILRIGSPPRVRGKRFASVPIHVITWITPACAGKTVAGNPDERTTEDHPRVCGENVQYSDIVLSAQGSPPRVRGKPARAGKGNYCIGITPACAGKTRGKNRGSGGLEDHPRVCGENLPCAF